MLHTCQLSVSQSGILPVPAQPDPDGGVCEALTPKKRFYLFSAVLLSLLAFFSVCALFQKVTNMTPEISITKKDMATSPVIPESFRTSALPKIPPLGLPRTPQASRWDDSLMELLDIFSPVSNPERYRINPSSQKSFVAPLSSQKTVFSPLRPSRSSLQDLEESEILEDIFFIC
ncbi:hypothetical protein F2P79_015080 [Pimephales promelas]|nr:hypothetical protein F2P79_015080 [Pimephales promelas]